VEYHQALWASVSVMALPLLCCQYRMVFSSEVAGRENWASIHSLAVLPVRALMSFGLEP
jgi:hypothetical protein